MQPYFKITADDSDITQVIQRHLIALAITDTTGLESDTLVITLDNRNQAIVPPATGAQLQVYIGYKGGGLENMGLWAVDEIELSAPPHTLIIRAKAVNFSSKKSGGKSNTLNSQKTRAWDNISIADMVQTIALDHGYQAKVAVKYASGELPDIGAPIQHLDQYNESDMSFLTRLALDVGALFKPVNGMLIFVERGVSISATGQVLTPVSFEESDLISWGVTLADRGRYDTAIAYYHNADSAERVAVSVGEGKPSKTVGGTFANHQAALAAASAKLQALQRGTARLRGKTLGKPSLQAGGTVKLFRFKTGLDDTYHVTRVVHTLSSDGFTTGFEAEA